MAARKLGAVARRLLEDLRALAIEDWAGHVAREAGDHVASEADRLGFPSRFLICVDAKCWKV